MRKLKSKRAYIYTIIVLIFYIILYFYLGNLKYGFARNPYSHELMTFLKNIDLYYYSKVMSFNKNDIIKKYCYSIISNSFN